MEKITIGMMFNDKIFEHALQRGISETNLSVIIKTFGNSVSSIGENDCDIYLIDEGYINLIENYSKQNALKNKIIVLTSPNNIEKYKANYCTIEKYSGIRAINDTINERHFSLTGKNRTLDCLNESKLLSFCSTKGGSGTTSCALETGRQLSYFENKKVIYLNVESQDSSKNYIPLNEEGDIRKLFLKMNIFKETKYNYPIESFTAKYKGIYYIKSKTYENYFASNPQNFIQLIKLLDNQKKFDYIIVDFGKELKSVWTEIINQSNIIFFVKNTSEKQSKMDKELIGRFDEKKVHLYLSTGEKEIDAQKRRKETEYFDIDPLSPFAANIKKLVKYILSNSNLE